MNRVLAKSVANAGCILAIHECFSRFDIVAVDQRRGLQCA